jgi:hypothetical protein
MAKDTVEIVTKPRTKPASPDDAEMTLAQKAERASNRFTKQAAEWASSQAEASPTGGFICPYCTGNYGIGEEIDAMTQHLIDTHNNALIASYMNPDLGFDALSILREREDATHAQAYAEGLADDAKDLKVLDDLNHFDYLHVPTEVKKRIEVEGGQLRWVAGHNVQRFKDKGLKVMARPSGEKMPHQNSHEDSTMRSNELTLMHVPAPIKDKLARLKDIKIEQQGTSTGSQELIQAAKRNEVGSRAYDHFKAKGMDHANAVRMADRAETAAGQGGIQQEQGERGFVHNR